MPPALEPYRIQDKVDVARPPAEVMARVRSPQTWPAWQSEIVRVEGPDVLDAGDEVTGDAKLAGFRVEGRSHVLQVTDASFVEDVIVGARMQVSYEIRPSGDGATITRTLEAQLPGGILGGMLSMFLRRKLKRMQRRLLRDLAAQVEAGASEA